MRENSHEAIPEDIYLSQREGERREGRRGREGKKGWEGGRDRRQRGETRLVVTGASWEGTSLRERKTEGRERRRERRWKIGIKRKRIPEW